ncbi:MAG: sigma 54-interacting transcriptional regulator, partial [Clostridium sp.]|nr:sigma 54-interacting transcriptional regulator [Clostridium sp.]
MQQFENIASRYRREGETEIRLIHVFGTPDNLISEADGDILVARGMTHDRLRQLLPMKHIVEIRLSATDILDALAEAERLYSPKQIAILIHNLAFRSTQNLERFCGAAIRIYDVTDEASARVTVARAIREGADVIVAAGTVCGICREQGFPNIHVKTKDDVIDGALRAAAATSLTINRERSRASLMKTIVNRSDAALLALDERGRILEFNNRMVRIFRNSPERLQIGGMLEETDIPLHWREALAEEISSELLEYGGENYLVQYQQFRSEDQGRNILITLKDAEQISKDEGRVRKELVGKGLTAKYTFSDILGGSPELRNAIRMARRYSSVDSNVLIIAETGCGKELFAHSIHRASSRRNEPFVAINCAALPENLLESELFGYAAGAFTGASRNGKAGLFEQANRGTIFLDEVGEMPLSLQAKLLRVLQEKEIRRVGSNSVQPVDVRVIAATNRNMEKRVEEGAFRADLYYRLDLLDIYIPPLRERPEDIPLYLESFLEHLAGDMNRPVPKLTSRAVERLRNYSWPGNVRELRNICERFVVLSDGSTIDSVDLETFRVFRHTGAPVPAAEGEKTGTLQSGQGTKAPAQVLPEREKGKAQIAKEMGVSRTTLWRMEKKKRMS